MLAAVVTTAPSTADTYGVLFQGLATVAGVILLPILLVFLIWNAARQNARQQKDLKASQVAATAAADASAASEQAAEDAFLKTYADWTDHSYSTFDKSFIAVDVARRRIALGLIGNAATYPFDSITAVELAKDGGVLTVHRDTPRGSASPYFDDRALLTAIESPTNTVATVRELGLKVTVNDASRPVYDVKFLHVFGATGLPVTDKVVVEAAERLDQFNGYLANALRDRRATGASPDAADELKKLWDLKQAGAITDEEYDAQKARLLSA